MPPILTINLTAVCTVHKICGLTPCNTRPAVIFDKQLVLPREAGIRCSLALQWPLWGKWSITCRHCNKLQTMQYTDGGNALERESPAAC